MKGSSQKGTEIIMKGMKRKEALRKGKGREKGNIMKGKEALRRGKGKRQAKGNGKGRG